MSDNTETSLYVKYNKMLQTENILLYLSISVSLKVVAYLVKKSKL